MAADTLIHRGMISLAVGRPLMWEHPPAGADTGASWFLRALGACQAGDRLMHGWREVGRIGRAGIPLPTAHYHLDDECYPARLGDHGDVFREWFTWAGIVQWLQQVRLMPPSTSDQPPHRPVDELPTPGSDAPVAELCIVPAARAVQPMSCATGRPG